MGAKEGDLAIAAVHAVAKAPLLSRGQEHHSVELKKLGPGIGWTNN